MFRLHELKTNKKHQYGNKRNKGNTTLQEKKQKREDIRVVSFG